MAKADGSLAILVGDSVTDIEASKRAGIIAVGYANKPGKADRLMAAGDDVVITNMKELAAYL